jgi:hypothetical protein
LKETFKGRLLKNFPLGAASAPKLLAKTLPAVDMKKIENGLKKNATRAECIAAGAKAAMLGIFLFPGNSCGFHYLSREPTSLLFVSPALRQRLQQKD